MQVVVCIFFLAHETSFDVPTRNGLINTKRYKHENDGGFSSKEYGERGYL